MKRPLTFICVLALSTGVGLSLLPAINLGIDRWGTLKRDYTTAYDIETPHPRVNAAFLRVAHLIENKEDYDSVIFGSSRVFHGFGTNSLNEKLGGKWYKLTYPGGAPYEHLHNLKALLANGVQIKRVLVGIDDADIYRFRNDEALYNFHPYPLSTTDWIRFYQFYLFKPVTFDELSILRGEVERKKYDWIIKRFFNQGVELPASASQESWQKRLRQLPPHGLHLLHQIPRIDFAVSALKEMRELCRSEGIEFDAFVSPRYLKTYYARDRRIVESFKQALAEEMPYHDFTAFNNYTTAWNYWYDTSHFTAEVGEAILTSLSSEHSQSDGFGVRVSKTTIDQHLKTLRQEASKHFLATWTNDRSAQLNPSYSTSVELRIESDGLETTISAPNHIQSSTPRTSPALLKVELFSPIAQRLEANESGSTYEIEIDEGEITIYLESGSALRSTLSIQGERQPVKVNSASLIRFVD
ncbi:hypothetical protein [Pelagicoccus sp. SDUM812003]|uniref:hypothetical protein n=1 Tax=Pelagicoccus sp. SDUM812003 TaxID=3041267 RepID=UPI00280CB7E5|nr:hypothetical protein [Pelagicoccus sp. SDUM812003]MDQ8202508.1 hypothetical protein [Pelagicoccus sp. SDUM812003]